MVKKVFYEKVGRRYVPVSEYDQELMDAFPQGNHLVMCYPGGQSRVYNIDPNYAALIAAARVARDPMHEAIRTASEMYRNEPKNRELTQEQLQACQNFVKVMGENGRYVHYRSVSDIADAGLNALEQEAAKLMTHPAVRDAYEQFVLLCRLTQSTNQQD